MGSGDGGVWGVELGVEDGQEGDNEVTGKKLRVRFFTSSLGDWFYFLFRKTHYFYQLEIGPISFMWSRDGYWA